SAGATGGEFTVKPETRGGQQDVHVAEPDSHDSTRVVRRSQRIRRFPSRHGVIMSIMKVGVLLCLLCTQAMADLAAGRRAFREGDYATALREFRTLVGEGNSEAQFFLGVM